MIIQKKEIRIELYNRLNRNSSIAQDTLNQSGEEKAGRKSLYGKDTQPYRNLRKVIWKPTKRRFIHTHMNIYLYVHSNIFIYKSSIIVYLLCGY